MKPIRAALVLGAIFAFSWVYAAVRLHPLGAVLVLILAAVMVRAHRRASRSRKAARVQQEHERAVELEAATTSALLEREAAITEERAQRAWRVERARRMAREGFTLAGGWDA